MPASRPPRQENEIFYSRSRYVYENKENMDKMAKKYADIFGNSTTMGRHFGRRSDQKSGGWRGARFLGSASCSRHVTLRVCDPDGTSILPCQTQRLKSISDDTDVSEMRQPRENGPCAHLARWFRAYRPLGHNLGVHLVVQVAFSRNCHREMQQLRCRAQRGAEKGVAAGLPRHPGVATLRVMVRQLTDKVAARLPMASLSAASLVSQPVSRRVCDRLKCRPKGRRYRLRSV